MKSKLLAATLLAMIVTGTAFAQTTETESGNTKKKVKKDESIIVHRKGDSKEKLTIVVDDEKVTINGKPIEEFKDENIEIVRSKARTFNATTSLAKIRGFGTTDNVVTGFAFNGNKAVLGVCSEKADKGVKVTCITKDGAAEKAGIVKDDIITKIGETKIETSDDLYKVVGKYNPDDKVTVTYLHDGKELTANVTLTKSKNTIWSGDNFRFENYADGYGQSYSYTRKPRLGMQIQDVEEGDGVKVLDVDDDTPAAKAGLKKDDVITEIDGASIKDVDELKTKLKDKKEGDSFKVKYKRDGKSQTAEIKYPKHLKTSSL